MKNIITNAAEITVLRLIDNTFKTGGGPISIGATCLVAGKGPVMKVTQVTGANWQSIFGKPLSKKSEYMEGLRHLADAVKDCTYVNVVRVVPDDAKFPSLSLTTLTGVQAAAAHDYGTTLSLGAGVCLQVWPIDGDPSTTRKFQIANVTGTRAKSWVTATVYVADDLVTSDGVQWKCKVGHTAGTGHSAPTVASPNATDWDPYTAECPWVTGVSYVANDVVLVTGGRLICVTAHTASTAPTLAAPGANWKVYDGDYDSRFTINFYDIDSDGDEYLLESYLVGLGINDKDDMGRPAYIETVLEQNSDIFRCNFDEDVSWDTAHPALKIVSGTKTAFTGGTNGAFDDEAAAVVQFKKGWDLFRNEQYLSPLMFAAGNYSGEVIANCIDIADTNHNSFFFDVSPNLTPTGAIDWLKGVGVESRQAACFYSPFSANDAYYGGKCVWGISGAVAAACAQGDANFTGATPGVHYAPAGIYRGKLARTGLQALNDDVINRDDFYTARINPVVASDTGGAVIDDCLSVWYKQNYSRFIWVNRIANYIDHRFVEAAAYMKFEPDGLTKTGLTKLTKQILDELVVSGALVTPRDPADGTNPYVLQVEQVEIDLWLVTWDFCPTGAARRIAGQPRLIK